MAPVRSIEAGFTLIELITVMVLVGALALVVLPRLSGRADIDAAAFEQELVAALRTARSVATASGCPVQVRIDSAEYGVYLPSGAAGYQCGNAGAGFTVPLPHPTGNRTYPAPVPGGVHLTATTVTFDGRGGAQTVPSGTIHLGGRTVSVVSETGYVH